MKSSLIPNSDKTYGPRDVIPIRPTAAQTGTLKLWRHYEIPACAGTTVGNEDKGIGSGSDQFAPLVGLAFVRDNTVLVPLVQHFVEIDGPEVNTTAFRMIAIQSFEDNIWGKIDAKVPVDWENDNEIPATLEFQVGKMKSPSFGYYADALFGVGSDRPYDWGVGVGVRFNY